MADNPHPPILLPWTRFWSPRKGRDHGTSGEFFDDPRNELGKHIHPHAVTISEITPESGLLVLCGEPGLGKTTELDLLREQLAVKSDDKALLIHLKARDFESFPDLQNHLEGQPHWQAWLSHDAHLSILLDGLDEGLIRMPTLVARLRSFLETKPRERLRLILSCRSFEWPEAEGAQLASLWKREEDTDFIFELEPLCREDARLAAERRGHNGRKFLEEVNRADVASLASRPITLFFLLEEFHGEGLRVTSRTQLYKNGCRKLCEESPERSRFIRRVSREECTTDQKVDAAGKLACGLLLGGKRSVWFSSSSESMVPRGNVCLAKELIDCGLLNETTVEQTLGTGVFTASGGDCFGFVHQTFAECLAGQTLSGLPLSQLRTLLCATDPASGNEYVIPQLVELAAWVAGDHSGFFSHLIDVDPAALLRSGLVLATPDQKAQLVARFLDLAGKNQFFDEYGYWRFWADLKHPGLADQLKNVLEATNQGLMARRVAISIAEACRLPELVSTFFDILRAQDGDQYFRSSVADALCACMPDDRLAELEPLARTEVGPDPDQSILGHALQRLVPTHWSVADALPYIGRTKDSSHFGSYWGALHKMPQHLAVQDILPGLQAIQSWGGGYSSTSFRRGLCMALLSRGLELIDDPAICEELVKLWKVKARDFREFFRTGDRKDSDFAKVKDEPRRKWIAAILNSSASDPDDIVDKLSWETYRLLKPDDFGWLLENLQGATEESALVWARTVQRMLWDEQIRVCWWDDFINAYRKSLALQTQMAWFEESSIETPARRSAKARWLWHERRYERLMKCRRNKESLDPVAEIANSMALISSGESWAFKNLCWALALKDEGLTRGHLAHDITEYPQWAVITEKQRLFVRDAARRFLLERSDGWIERRARTNYSDPGVAAIWMLRDQIESDKDLRSAVSANWMESILHDEDSSADHTKELFSLVYRINPRKTIRSWMREIRRDLQRCDHPFAIRMAEHCFDSALADEIIEFTKSLKDPEAVRMTIYEIRELDKELASGLAFHLLRHALLAPRKHERLVSSLIIAGMGTGSREVWRSAYSFLETNQDIARQIILKIAGDADSRNRDHFGELSEDEIGDFYLLLCRLFPHSEDPTEQSGWVSPRSAVVYLRSKALETLSAKCSMAACNELRRLAAAMPDQATWLLYRCQQTLSAVRRNEWSPVHLPYLGTLLADEHKRIIRDDSDLMNLVLEALQALQRHLKETALPAVEDLWHWEGAGLKRKNFRHKDEEAVSDYVARWLRDRIGPQSGVVVNREVQPRRGQRTDILVEAWNHSPEGKNRQEHPLCVTVEVKGCWNAEIKNGANVQLLDGYLRPFGRTHGIFLVAWFHSPGKTKSDDEPLTQLKFDGFSDALSAVVKFTEPAQVVGFEIAPFVLDCRL